MPITHAHPAMPGHAPGSTHADHPGESERRRSSPPLLWFALIVAMFAAALLWLRVANHEPVAAAPTAERMLPATPVSAPAQPAAAERSSTAQRQPATSNRAAAPAGNRQAQPLASNAKPAYPASALRSGVQGSVIASLQVGTDGRVSDANIVARSGTRDRNLDRAVLTAVRDWRFEPALENGRAVASVVRVPVDFRTER